jgi:cation:H+ antiporter
LRSEGHRHQLISSRPLGHSTERRPHAAGLGSPRAFSAPRSSWCRAANKSAIIGFDELPLAVNATVFTLAALAVWLAGTRLTRYADAVADRTGLGQALIGALLLGGVTSLPELATTSTAAIAGNADLAVNNILGGVAMQLAVLALADALIGERGLSTLASSSSLMLQGNGLMVVLALAASGIISGSVVVLGIDLWTTALLVVVVLVLASIRRYEQNEYWRPVEDEREETPAEPRPESVSDEQNFEGISNSRLVSYTVLGGLVVVAAGFVVTTTGEAISVQTGIGASFAGAILLALATSLPEVSTTLEAVRLRKHRLAFSNIFGTNLFDVGLLFVADAFYRGGGILDAVGEFSLFAAVLGILITGVYVAGILYRRKLVVLRMGIDSAIVLILYLGGTVVLYGMR